MQSFDVNKRSKPFCEESRLKAMRDYKYYSLRCALSEHLSRICKQLPNTFTDDEFLGVVAKELHYAYSSSCNYSGKAYTDKWIKVYYLRIRSDYFGQLSSVSNGINLRFTRGKYWLKIKK